MSKTVKAVRKLGVVLLGFPLLIIGIILIPLPGPGLLVVFAALLLLSSEFEWAGRYADKTRKQIKNIFEKSQARADKIGQSSNKKE